MWPLYQSLTWLCGWGPLSLSFHSAKSEVHRPYGTGNNGVCNVSSNSDSIFSSCSKAEVPMPRFTNERLNVVDCLHLNCCYWHESQTFGEKSHLWANNHILFIAYWRHQNIRKFLLERNGIKVRVFFGKNFEKMHLCHNDKNIPVINLIADSRNVIKVSKNMNL